MYVQSSSLKLEMINEEVVTVNVML